MKGKFVLLPIIAPFAYKFDRADAKYDYSGYGASTGKPSEYNTYADIKAVYQCLQTEYGVGQEDLILYGQSVGSSPTLHLAAHLPRLRGVVLHSAILSGLRVYGFLETVTGGSSSVGQTRNREESSTFSSAAVNLWKKPCLGLVAHSSKEVQSDVSPPPTVVVQKPLLAPVMTLSESRAPNEAGVPAAPPSSTDVGGDELEINVQQLEAFLRRCEQMDRTDDLFFTSLEQVDAFLISDDTPMDSTVISWLEQ
ncbi:Endomembrane protein 70 [Musa troglodytarum]|uniref:Endomembrane protein 70 n=1 Tax=Musa troglodytarum TaxID=320322 RepID=A0A9E7L330_9LILI|nr:Endomembrane protein 70 [Musa troglodytarum]